MYVRRNPNSSPLVASLPLLALCSFATFVIGLGAFVVIGLLSPIAAYFHLPITATSLLMTTYAFIYAATSPVLGAAAGSANRALVIACGLLVFLFGCLLAACAPSYPVLLVARAIMAIGGGLTAPLLASVGAELAPPAQRGRALSINFAGFALAQVLGVPVGSWLGYSFGWRISFLVVASLAALACGLVFKLMPRDIHAAPSKVSTLVEILLKPSLALAILFAIPFVGGVYVLYAFLTPFLEARYALARDGIAFALALYGTFAVVGNGLGGWASDRIGPSRTLAALCLVQCVLMPCLTLMLPPLAVTFAMIATWSAASWAFFATQQSRLARGAPDKALPLFALNSSAVYLGGAVGPAIGAATIKTSGMGALGPIGALLVLGALALLAIAENI